MSRAVFLSIVRQFVIDQTCFPGENPGCNQPSSEYSDIFHPALETAIDEIINYDSTNQQLFPTGRTLVKEEIARIALHPLYGDPTCKSLEPKDISRILAFLSMPDYEVNLVALEFLHGLFLKHPAVLLADENIGGITKELLRLMLDSNMKGECLAMVIKWLLQSIHRLKNKSSLFWSFWNQSFCCERALLYLRDVIIASKTSQR